MKQWRALPRSKRDRLTKKQIAMIDKPDLMADSLAITTVKERKKGTFTVEDKTNKTNENLFDFTQKQTTIASKVFKEDQPQPSQGGRHVRAPQQSRTDYRDDNEQQKRKPKQIMVEYRDADNQVVKVLIDKAVKKRITPLKKAIIKKRELEKQARQLRKEEKKRLSQGITQLKEAAIAEVGDESDDGYETIDDAGEQRTQIVKSNNIPYRPIFDNLESIFEEIGKDICNTQP